jgi:hypothetical protein
VKRVSEGYHLLLHFFPLRVAFAERDLPSRTPDVSVLSAEALCLWSGLGLY